MRLWKKTLILALLTTVPLLAQTLPKNGQAYESVSIDLNGDGRPEKISLVAYNVDPDEESFWGRLQVSDGSGKVIWQGPTATRPGQPFAFGMWPWGATGLEWVGDIDGDGKVELVAKAPISDVRPATFHRYRWNGQAFQAMSSKMLLASSGSKPGKLLWRDPFEWDGARPLLWGTALSGAPNQIIVEIMDYRNNGSIWGGTALTQGDGLGLIVKSWSVPYGPPSY
jgi:hypothetical protein